MKKILLSLFITIIVVLLFIFLANKKVKETPNIQLNNNIYDETKEKLVGPFVPGLKITSIEKDSPLNKVGLTVLAEAEKYGESSLKIGDVITGVSLDYKKSNFWDILTKEQKSEYFIPVETEQELYQAINNIGSNKIILGVVRKEFKGITKEESGFYRYRPDLAVFSIEKLNGNYLKATMIPNINDVSQ